MPHISRCLICLIALASFSGIATAKTDPACLKHLGGGYSDAQCYQGLGVDVVAKNKHLYKSILKTIPADNIHVKLLDKYMTAQDQGIKYCELQRNAGAKWKTEHDGSMFPAIYEQCVYELRMKQNKFLENLLEMARWQ